MVVCAQCGEDNPDRARFCLACGAPLAATPTAEVRKTVTVLFADVTGSTALGEQLDPEALRTLMLRYFDAMASVIARHGGTVEKFVGDAVMAVFGVPRVHEDDALRAVRAALEMREELDRLNTELEALYGVHLQIRTGVNTGEVVAGRAGDPTLVSGDAVNLAARLEQAAASGEIYLGPVTHELVRDAVMAEPGAALSLKGKSSPVTPWRLEAVMAAAHGRARRFDTPFVGRRQELELLAWAFERVLREQACHVVTLLGAAGVGKSRLVTEALAHVRDRADVLVGRCLPYGEGITYWPVSEIVRQASGIGETDDAATALGKLRRALGADTDGGGGAVERVATEVAALLGLGGRRQGSDGTWAVRKLLEALARRRPLVVVFEDLHWAEPTLLDLVEHVADWSRDAPLLLLAVARPELLDERPGWGGGKLNSTSLLLEPLDPGECQTLLSGLLGSASVDRTAAERITAATAGNPLFLEEMLRMLVDDGLLRRTGSGWAPTADLDSVAMPPTVTALLTARLDRIDRPEREVLDRAAVVGETFERGAVIALAPEVEQAGVPARLLALVRKELLRAGAAVSVEDEVFAFRHLLVRDAVYAALPKTVRADLHERFARWLEGVTPSRNLEYDEVIAYHLEQTVSLRGELGVHGHSERRLAESAARRLAAGGRRAFGRGDMPAAVKLLRRSIALQPPDDAGGADLLLTLGTAMTETGDLQSAQAAMDRAAGIAATVDDAGARARVRLGQLWLRSSLDLDGWAADAEREATEALAVFRALDDDQGKARAEALLAEVLYLRCHVADSEAALRRAAAHAERAGDLHEAIQAVAALAFAAVDGPLPVGEGIARCEEILRRYDGHRSVEARTLRALALLRAMGGELDAGR